MKSSDLPQRKLIRLDKDLYESASRPCFLTICTKASLPLFQDSSLAGELVSCLLDEASGCGILIFAYCVMPDHIHMLCGPREEGRSVIQFMHHFKGKSTAPCWEHGLQGKVWQRGYYDHVVRQEESLREIIEYVLANCVRVGLAEDYTKYEFCGTPDPLPPGS